MPRTKTVKQTTLLKLVHWRLLVAIVCYVAYTLHCRIADARYTSWDRLYYNSIFRSVLSLSYSTKSKSFLY